MANGPGLGEDWPTTVSIAETAIRHPDPTVRSAGLMLLAVKIRKVGTPEGRVGAQALRQTAVSALQLLSDPDVRVRAAAIRMGLGIDYHRMKAGAGLPAEVSSAFRTAFFAESATDLRVNMIRTMVRRSASGTVPSNLAEVLDAGLGDKRETVILAAVEGVRHTKHSGGIRRVALLISHPSVPVRLAAAGVLRTAGAMNVRPHLPALKRAVRIEPDPTVRRTLAAAVTAVSPGRQPAGVK